jgi:hypothetical protein
MTSILFLIISLPIWVVGHLLFFRVFRPSRFVFYSLLFGIVAFFLSIPKLFIFQLNEIIFIIFILFSFWFLFITFLINLQNSVSLRILNELKVTDHPTFEESRLKNLINESDCLDARLERLVANGLIQKHNNELVLTWKGYYLAKTLLTIRNLLKIKAFG